MRRDSEALADGGIGSGVGTMAMSLVMRGARRAGLVGALPPGRMAAALCNAVGLRARPRWARNALAVVLHLGVGAAAGGLFALLRGRLRMPVAPALQGLAYGVVVWLVSYMGWVPAVGLLPVATRDEPRRPVGMVVAHGVYGAVLGALVGHRSRRRGMPPPRQDASRRTLSLTRPERPRSSSRRSRRQRTIYQTCNMIHA